VWGENPGQEEKIRGKKKKGGKNYLGGTKEGKSRVVGVGRTP